MDVDFNEIRTKHAQWRIRLNKFLKNQENITIEQAGTHRDCALGKWIHSEGRAQFGHLKEMLDLAKTHRDMHEAVLATIRAKEAGNPTAAAASLAEVEALSRKVVQQIRTVEMIVHVANSIDP
jgi:methyl-accepting chemotaxis protein